MSALNRPSATSSARSRLVAATRRTSMGISQVAADGPHLSVLKHTQQFQLQLERQLGHLVEHQRSALRLLCEPGAIPQGAGERAAPVSKELRFEQRARYGAIEGHECRCRTPTGTVQGTGKDFLAGPGLAQEQDRSILRRAAVEQRQRSQHGGASTDDRREWVTKLGACRADWGRSLVGSATTGGEVVAWRRASRDRPMAAPSTNSASPGPSYLLRRRTTSSPSFWIRCAAAEPRARAPPKSTPAPPILDGHCRWARPSARPPVEARAPSAHTPRRLRPVRRAGRGRVSRRRTRRRCVRRQTSTRPETDPPRC